MIRCNIILPSTHWSSKWFFRSGFPTTTICAFLFSPIRATFPALLPSKLNMQYKHWTPWRIKNQAVSWCSRFFAVLWPRRQACSCGIRVGRSGNGTVFPSNTSVFPVRTIPPMLHTYLSIADAIWPQKLIGHYDALKNININLHYIPRREYPVFP